MDIGNVSSLTIACMAISGVLSVFVPIVAVIVLGVRKRLLTCLTQACSEL